MVRPTRIRNDDLLQTARSLFLRQGPSVSTSEIAQAAGVSEGSLFKRFGNKEALFLAAMGLKELDWTLDVQAYVGAATVPENLHEIALDLLTYFEVLLPRLTCMSGHPKFHPTEFLRHHPSPPPLRATGYLTEYLEFEIQGGRARACAAEVVARTLHGSLWGYAFFEHTGLNERLNTDRCTFVKELIDLLWRGLQPSQSEREA